MGRLIFFAVALAFSVTIHAEQRTKRPQPKPTPTPAPVEHLEVEKRFDKFKNVTTLSIGDLRLKSADGLDLRLYVLYSFSGTEPPAKARPYPNDESAYFVIISRGNRYRFDDAHDLTLLLDGKPMGFGDLTYKPDYNPPDIEERMSVFVAKDTLLKIASAKVVEGKLGIHEFSFEPRHLKAIRALAEMMPSE